MFYTVGLSLRGLPELLVRGLPAPPATELLNLLAERQCGGARLGDRDDLDVLQLRSAPYPEGVAYLLNVWAHRPPHATIAALELVMNPALLPGFTRPGS